MSLVPRCLSSVSECQASTWSEDECLHSAGNIHHFSSLFSTSVLINTFAPPLSAILVSVSLLSVRPTVCLSFEWQNCFCISFECQTFRLPFFWVSELILFHFWVSEHPFVPLLIVRMILLLFECQTSNLSLFRVSELILFLFWVSDSSLSLIWVSDFVSAHRVITHQPSLSLPLYWASAHTVYITLIIYHTVITGKYRTIAVVPLSF